MSESTTPKAPKFELPEMTLPDGTELSAELMLDLCASVSTHPLRGLIDIDSFRIFERHGLMKRVRTGQPFVCTTDAGRQLVREYGQRVLKDLEEAGMNPGELTLAIQNLPYAVREAMESGEKA
jgi:hypothetical protein